MASYGNLCDLAVQVPGASQARYPVVGIRYADDLADYRRPATGYRPPSLGTTSQPSNRFSNGLPARAGSEGVVRAVS